MSNSCSIQQYKELRDCRNDLSACTQEIEVLEKSIHFKNTLLNESLYGNFYVLMFGLIIGWLVGRFWPRK